MALTQIKGTQLLNKTITVVNIDLSTTVTKTPMVSSDQLFIYDSANPTVVSRATVATVQA
jgi:hypothetical protein